MMYWQTLYIDIVYCARRKLHMKFPWLYPIVPWNVLWKSIFQHQTLGGLINEQTEKWNECFPKIEISILICETEVSDMNFEHWTMWHIIPTFEIAWHKTIVKLSLCLSLSISQSLNLSLSMRDRDRADTVITVHHPPPLQTF